MSLKGFHILLISLSSLLALAFGAWSARAYSATGEPEHLGFAVFSFVAAVGLLVYVIWFARKVRSRVEEDRERRRMLRPLAVLPALWLLRVGPADACSVCYGQAEGQLIDAARLGVWLLFGLVFAMQLAIATFFVCLRRRARAQQHRRVRADRPAAGALPTEESAF